LRAAELLEASGAAAGFNVGVQFAGVDSALANDDSIESSDADFNLIIKRMSKKDSTTKLKVMSLKPQFMLKYNLCASRRTL